MLKNFQGEPWGSIPPLCMPSLLHHDLCHGQGSSHWDPVERGVPSLHMRQSLTSMLKFHRNTVIHVSTERNIEVLVSTPDATLCPCSDWRENMRGTSQLTSRLDFLAATWVGPRGSYCNSRGTPRFLQQLEKTQEILASTRDEAL